MEFDLASVFMGGRGCWGFNLASFQQLQLAVLFTCFALMFLLSNGKTRRKDHHSSSIPGPGTYFLGSIVNSVVLSDMKKTLPVFDDWCKKYNPIFKVNLLTRSMVILNSPEYIQKLLGSTDMNHFHKGFSYEVLKSSIKDGLIVSTGEKWKLRRKLVHKNMFSYKTLVRHMEIFNEETDLLVRTLGEKKENIGVEMEIHEFLNTTIFNSITKATTGKSGSDLESVDEGDIVLKEIIARMKELMGKRLWNPWLLSKFLWRLHPLSKVEDSLLAMFWKQVKRAVGGGDEPLIWSNSSNLKDSLLNDGLTLEGILEETNTLIQAGYETTASSSQFLLFLLALHPAHQELCRKEVDSLFDETGDFLRYQDLTKLKHLEMCVLETLRLFPIGFGLTRMLKAPLKLERNLELDAGTEVAIYVPGIHKNPKYYPDPEKFIPERFVDEERKLRHPYAFIPFSAGPRRCIGYKFAMMGLMCLTAKLLRHYVISTKDKLQDVVLLPHMTLTLENPIRFILHRRGQLSYEC